VGVPSRRGRPVAVVAVVVFLGCLSCSGLPSHPDDLGLIPVLRVYRGELAADWKDLCQVDMEVDVMMPDCGAFGPMPERVEGNTFHFALHATYFGNCTGAPDQESLSLCLPGKFQNPPPPPLPAGTYFVEVNGVTGTFTMP